MPLKVLLFCLVVTLSVAIMATDLYLPCLPMMVRDFNVTEAAVQKTISLSFLGVCISSFVAGPLADRFTKQRIFTLAMILFIVTGILSPLSPSVDVLWLLRFFQGLAVGCLPVIIMALVADIYEGRRLTQVMTMLGVVLTFSLALSPVLGGWIGEFMGWKGCFWITSAVATGLTIVLWGRFPKAIDKKPKPLSWTYLGIELKNLWRYKTFLGLMLCHSLVFAAALSYRTTLSHYFADVLHVGPLEFGTFVSGVMIANVMTGLSMSALMMHFSTFRILDLGIAMFVISAIALGLLCYFAPEWPAGLFAVMILINIAVPLCFSTTLSLALQDSRLAKGFASSALVSSRSLLAGLFIYISGVIYTPNLWSIAVVFIFLVLFLAPFYIFMRTRGDLKTT